MAKYLIQSEQPRKKHTFLICSLVYAVVFLGAIALALTWLWGCMEAYEKTRPAVVRDAYLNQLTEEHICDLASETYDAIDHQIQSVEDCRAYILDNLSGEVTCAKKTAESTQTQQVYALRCNGKTIGSFAMTAETKDAYGFASWQVAWERVDVSCLLGEKVTVRVPEGYTVLANGFPLEESYVSQTEEVPYSVFAEFYENYDLPMLKMLTYEVEPVLGEITLEIRDAQGEEAVLGEDKDYPFPDNCTQQQEEQLQTFVEEFLRRYVVFSGCANDARVSNYLNVVAMVVDGSRLQTRMRDAIDGLQFAQSNGDKIASINIHQMIDLGEGKYLCDVTYLVDTTGHKGVVQTSNNVKIIITETDSGLKAEAMTSY